MAGNIGVDMSVIVSTASQVRSYNSTMKSKLSSVSEGVGALKASWESEASKSLSTIASKMNDRFAELEKSVEKFAQFLDTVAENYEKTEQTTTETTRAVESEWS